MNGLSANVFLEKGVDEWIGEMQCRAADDPEKLKEQVLRVLVQTFIKIREIGNVPEQHLGFYLEVFAVHPALQGHFNFKANALSLADQTRLNWHHTDSRTKAARGESNGQV